MTTRTARLGFRAAVSMAVIAAGLLCAAAARPQAGGKTAAASRFIGAAKCKNCHASKASGDQYAHWTKEKHFAAYERLASDESKALAKTKGIEDPQKAEQCVKCHTTAAKEADDRLMKGFDRHAGVQCESCHGPGEKHMKARMAAAADAADSTALQEIPKDEIIGLPDQATCVTCHNAESPSYKPFCYKKRLAEIAHLDPRKKRPADYLDTIKCTCEECKKTGG